MNPTRLPAFLLAFLLVPPLASARTHADPQSDPNAASSRHSAARAKEATAPAPPSAYNGHPRLAIILVIDQFRGDYLDRYRADFKNHGFNLFLQKGAYFPDC
jgi:hypothetical protein